MVPGHAILAEYLKETGYLVYPDELNCGPHNLPHDRCRWVDVAAYKNGGYYAFEYKSSGDPISGAVNQIENYRRSFDYVILLVEIPRKGRSGVSLNAKGKGIYEIIRLGAGIWIASRNPASGDHSFREISKPRLQSPHSLNRKHIMRQFKLHYQKHQVMKFDIHPSQKKLDHYVTSASYSPIKGAIRQTTWPEETKQDIGQRGERT